MSGFGEADVEAVVGVLEAWDAGRGWEIEITQEILDAVVPAMRARWRKEAADEMDAYRAEVYPETVFRRPTVEDYAAINALLFAERGHKLDGVAADCMDRAIRVTADRLRSGGDSDG